MPQDLDQAQATLAAQVYEPAFFAKCAELGIEFPDRATFDDALETVVRLKDRMQQEQASVVKSAADALRQSCGAPSTAQKQAEQTKRQKIAAAVEALQSNPAVQAAALAVREAK